MEQLTIYQLPELHYLRLRFKLMATENTRLPHFKGSMLRGAFGHALRKTVCAMDRDVTCADCMLKAQCAYTRLFETFITGEPPRFLRGLDTAPRPFVFECADLQQEFVPGSPLEFDLILLGSAIDFVPYIVFSVLQMCQTGLGPDRNRFELSQVDCFQPESENDDGWSQLYDAATQCLVFSPQPTKLAQNPPMTDDQCLMTKLCFVTPTRLKFKGKYKLDFTFRDLVFKLIRRILELTYFYMPDEEINWEFHDLLVAASEVQITERNLRWSDWHRYSNRQQTKIDMSGFVGEMVLSGDLTPFMDLLRYCEVVHVGKGAVFGLGRMDVAEKMIEDCRF